jgi:hypothetical protein
MIEPTSAHCVPLVIVGGRPARGTGGVGGRRKAARLRSARTLDAFIPRFRPRFRGFLFFPAVQAFAFRNTELKGAR